MTDVLFPFRKPDAANGQILVVDDDEDVGMMLSEAIAAGGYVCSYMPDAEYALEELERETFDVVLTDINMPGLSGLDLLRLVKDRYDCDVIVMTGDLESFRYDEIIQSGASDFLTKPIRPKELILRLKRVIRERRLLHERNSALVELESANVKLQQYTIDLTKTILDLRELHDELKDAYLDTINRLVLAAEYKDEDTGDHILRMSRYSAIIAEGFGLSNEEVQNILYAAPMHDVGKIGIPDSILMKPGRLTDEEFAIVKTHTTIGARILADSKAEILRLASRIALTHHERWDGKGYPKGLSNTQIPICGRIVALADVFDALTSQRPYKDPYPIEVALEFIRNGRSTMFDPEIVDVFFSKIDEIILVRGEVRSLADSDGFSLSDRDEAESMEKLTSEVIRPKPASL